MLESFSKIILPYKGCLHQGYTTFSSRYKLIVTRPAKGLYNFGQPIVKGFLTNPSLTQVNSLLTLYRVVLMMTSCRCTNTLQVV